MSLPVLDDELVLDDLKDVVPPCDFEEKHDCPNPAEWVIHWTCSCVNLLCPKHKDEYLRVDKMPGDWTCTGHRRVIRMIRVEPLR